MQGFSRIRRRSSARTSCEVKSPPCLPVRPGLWGAQKAAVSFPDTTASRFVKKR